MNLPIYGQWGPSAKGMHPDHGCQKCALGAHAKNVCAGEDPDAGGRGCILVVMGSPTREEDEAGVIFTSRSAERVREQVDKHAGDRPVRYAYAVRCPLRKDVSVEDVVEECRPYLWGEIARYQPDRIVVVGPLAVRALSGLYLDASTNRRGWTRVEGIPAYFVMDAVDAARNYFLAKQFAKDVAWAVTCPVPGEINGEVRVLKTAGEVGSYLTLVGSKRPVVVDVEHDGQLWGPGFRLLCVGLCADLEDPVVVPGDLVTGEAAELFRAFLSDANVPKVGQNIKHDRHALYRALGADMRGIVADTYLWARMREPEALAGLGKLAWLVGMGGYKEAAKDLADDDDGKGGNRFAQMRSDDLHAYNGRDTSCTLRVYDWQRPLMGKLLRPWQRLISPAFNALAVVERQGILLSEDAVRAYDKWLEVRETQLMLDMGKFPEVPTGFDPKPRQVAELLYDKLGIECKVRTDKGAKSVSAEALRAVQGAHPIIPLLQELFTIKKQRSTYGLSMLEHISPVDGRVHTTFDLVRSGRLSSKRPNVQNITRPEAPGDEGEWARGCFVASPGNVFVQLDYGQLELRVAAMLSGDEEMAAAFGAGYDFHTMTAAAAYGIAPAAVTKGQRSAAKALNFAIIFGQSEFGIAKAIGVTKERAAELMASLLGKYKKLDKWRRDRIAEAKVDGRLWTVWDPPGAGLGWVHYRSVHGIGEIGDSEEARRKRKHWSNVALNNPIQNIANCFALASLIEVVRWTLDERPEVKVVMTVHDSILFECPEGMTDEVVAEGSRIMTQWPSGIVKLVVDAEVGKDWGRLQKVKKAAAAA